MKASTIASEVVIQFKEQQPLLIRTTPRCFQFEHQEWTAGPRFRTWCTCLWQTLQLTLWFIKIHQFMWNIYVWSRFKSMLLILYKEFASTLKILQFTNLTQFSTEKKTQWHIDCEIFSNCTNQSLKVSGMWKDRHSCRSKVRSDVKLLLDCRGETGNSGRDSLAGCDD